MFILFILQIAFVANAAKVRELSKKFGFEKSDVINLKPGRSRRVQTSLNYHEVYIGTILVDVFPCKFVTSHVTCIFYTTCKRRLIH